MGRRVARSLLRFAGASALLLALGLLLLLLSLPNVTDLRTGWPDRTAFMERRLAEAESEGRPMPLRYDPVPLASIPESVLRAVLVSEDATFFRHAGFDLHEIGQALREAWEERTRPRGASTITQQLARNLYLSPDRNLLRKVREAVIAWRMEELLSKRRILELYLNVIELGPGVFGVEAASRSYFGRSVSSVTRTQAARLAATIPSPLLHNPATATGRFLWRERLVFQRAFGRDRRGR